jgi:hypothetical protein
VRCRRHGAGESRASRNRNDLTKDEIGLRVATGRNRLERSDAFPKVCDGGIVLGSVLEQETEIRAKAPKLDEDSWPSQP